MPNYITVTAPTGQEIKFDFRHSCSLLIFTSFNPIRKLCFVDRIESIESVDYVSHTHRYDDGTGYISVALKKGYDKQNIIEGITDAFEKEFGITSYLIPLP